MIILSITGLFRTLLIIAGVFVLLRFIGKLMIAKRNMEEHQRVKRSQQQSEEAVDNARKNFGRTTISGKSNNYKDSDFVDYEELD